MPGTYVGTLVFQDAATAAGTTASTPIITFGLPTTSIPQSIEINARCRNGLLYQATGTPVVTFTYD